MKTQVKSFINQFMAVLKGDTDKVVAEKVFRKASASLKSQISQQEGDLITLEDAVEAAKENIAKARVNNGKIIEDGNIYVETLIGAQNELIDAQEELEAAKKQIAFLQSELDNISKEEDEASIIKE